MSGKSSSLANALVPLRTRDSNRRQAVDVEIIELSSDSDVPLAPRPPVKRKKNVRGATADRNRSRASVEVIGVEVMAESSEAVRLRAEVDRLLKVCHSVRNLSVMRSHCHLQ